MWLILFLAGVFTRVPLYYAFRQRSVVLEMCAHLFCEVVNCSCAWIINFALVSQLPSPAQHRQRVVKSRWALLAWQSRLLAQPGCYWWLREAVNVDYGSLPNWIQRRNLSFFVGNSFLSLSSISFCLYAGSISTAAGSVSGGTFLSALGAWCSAVEFPQLRWAFYLRTCACFKLN